MKRISSRLPNVIFLYVSLLAYAFILPMINHADQAEGAYDQAVAKLLDMKALGKDYALRQEIFRAVSQRAPMMAPAAQWKLARMVARYSMEHDHDPYLLLAVIETESGYKFDAVSNKGAVGFMQVRPFVARDIAGEVNINPGYAEANLTDAETNLKLGSYYLSKMKIRFGSLDLALAAYNQGPTLLSQSLKDGRQPDMKYVMKVLKSRKLIKKGYPLAAARRAGALAGV